MDGFNKVSEATEQFRAFVYAKDSTDSLPPLGRDKLLEAANMVNPPQVIARGAEALYAVSDDLDDEGMELCAKLSAFAGSYGFNGMGRADRGLKMADTMQRRRGIPKDEGEWHDPSEDPKPDPKASKAIPIPQVKVNPPTA